MLFVPPLPAIYLLQGSSCPSCRMRVKTAKPNQISCPSLLSLLRSSQLPTGISRIPAQLVYDWLAQLAVPPIAVTELRRSLPLCAVPASLPEEDHEATVASKTTTTGELAPEGVAMHVLVYGRHL